MEALFVHDHIFYKNDNKYYSPGGLPADAWERYLNHIDKLFVISRGSNEIQNSGIINSSSEHVEFDLFFDVKGGLDYYKYSKSIKEKLRIYIEKVDYVIIRVPSTIGYFAYQICIELNKPYIAEVVGCAWDSTWNYGSTLIKMQAPIRFLQMKKVVANSYATTYVTEFFLQNRYKTNSEITTFASNVQIPETDSEVRNNHLSLIKNTKHENKVFKIGIIGNLNIKYKGFDTAMKALKICKESFPSIKFEFLLVGGGDQNYIKNLIKEYNLESDCQIIGRLQAGSEVFNFLDSLNLYIHPSRQEGLPRSVIEAMSRACPVLASNVAGIPELINSKYLHKPGDFKKLANDINAVLSNVGEQCKMSEENFLKSTQYYKSVLEKRRFNFFKQVTDNISKIK